MGLTMHNGLGNGFATMDFHIIATLHHYNQWKAQVQWMYNRKFVFIYNLKPHSMCYQAAEVVCWSHMIREVIQFFTLVYMYLQMNINSKGYCNTKLCKRISYKPKTPNNIKWNFTTQLLIINDNKIEDGVLKIQDGCHMFVVWPPEGLAVGKWPVSIQWPSADHQ